MPTTINLLRILAHPTRLIMSQVSPTELLAQLKALVSSPPQALIQDTHLRSQLYHAAREAMMSLEDAPGPITRVAVAQVCP